MYSTNESVRMAQKFIDSVLDAEEALSEGEVEEAHETLRVLKENMLFAISENHYANTTILTNTYENKYIH